MAIRINLHDVGFPGSSVGKESTCNMGDLGLIHGLGRSPGEGKSYPLQYPSLENSMDCIVLGVGVVVCHIHELISTQLQTQWGSSADL